MERVKQALRKWLDVVHKTSEEKPLDTYLLLDEMKPWNDRLQMLEVVNIIDEAPEVKTFTFRSDAQTWFKYKPGQFITLELPVDEQLHLRTYTLSSSPSRPFTISITAKAQADSIGTRWMFDHLKPGDFLKAYGPAGGFTHFAYPAAKYLFISAGSGATPMMSMLRWLSDCAPGTDVSFVSCARYAEEILFYKELDLLWHKMPLLSLGFLVQQRSSKQSWSGHFGKINSARLPLLCADFMDREIFCCGPEPFMDLIQVLLKDAGFNMAHYHQESFNTLPDDAPSEPVNEVADALSGNINAVDAQPVRFALSNIDSQCLPGQTILQAARSAGVRIPAACENGLCGTCKTLKISGEIEMNHNGGILDEEIEEGYFLACCSKPLTPVEVDA